MPGSSLGMSLLGFGWAGQGTQVAGSSAGDVISRIGNENGMGNGMENGMENGNGLVGLGVMHPRHGISTRCSVVAFISEFLPNSSRDEAEAVWLEVFTCSLKDCASITST